jgi:hypothetical protein
MSDVVKLIKLLMEEGFQMRLVNNPTRERYAVAHMLPMWQTMPMALLPHTYGELPIVVTGFSSEKDMRKHARMILLSSRFTFIRTFVKGKEDEPSVGDGVVPEAWALLRADNPRKKRAVEQLEERSELKRRKTNGPATPVTPTTLHATP